MRAAGLYGRPETSAERQREVGAADAVGLPVHVRRPGAARVSALGLHSARWLSNPLIQLLMLALVAASSPVRPAN